MSHVATTPTLGAGLGYRAELHSDVLANTRQIDWLEIISEQYMNAAVDEREHLLALRREFRLVPHGVNLSLGTPGEPDWGYVEALAELIEIIDAPWCSDHLCFTRTESVDLATLTPLPRSRALARELGSKAQRIQERLGIPFIWENIAYHVEFDSDLTEAQFISEFLESCDCGLLLDLTNLFINSVNHDFDPLGFLETIPLERVVQVHVAGGVRQPAVFYDTHSRPVHEEVWNLLERVASETELKGVLLERDQDFPDDFSEILRDVGRARHIMERAQAAGA
ncbi:DUF692 family multinuclear iron-containing protein [Streptomyces sp. R11]|uniref:DUF692 family multinuclear iron-containing protein n=1 Tax=Streptomyces sp. R11 TaxID=3238625 RepID=A0AB39NDH7_9ACTN